VVEIGDEDREALLLVLRDERLHRVAEIGLTLWVELAEEAEHLEDARLASRRRHAIHHLVGGGDDAHAIEVREADVAERRRDALRVAQLLRIAEAHRARRVDDEVDGEVLFFFEEANEETIEALIH